MDPDHILKFGVSEHDAVLLLEQVDQTGKREPAWARLIDALIDSLKHYYTEGVDDAGD